MNLPKIPVSILVVACLYVAVGAIGSLAHIRGLKQPDGAWIELTELLAIVSGVFILRRKNWARWLAVAWMAFHVVISWGSWGPLAMHSLFLIVIAWVLFRSEARRYFGGVANDI